MDAAAQVHHQMSELLRPVADILAEQRQPDVKCL
jgi:hypothetical protein